ncbi:MAG: hypothetical protein JWN10_2905 [Solirubrobacterales bacterium]|nr:hypothetical protein [Solirubrobacterales bacterium]
MSTREREPAKLHFRAAMESRDLAAILDTFAPDAVFRSPLTDKLTFNGREQIAALTEVVLDVFEDLRYTHELSAAGDGFLVGRAQVGGQDIEWVDHLTLDSDGKIRELTVFFRPLPATAAALRVIGVGLSRRKSPVRAALISALARPLGLMTRAGDGLGTRLVRPTL